MTRFLASCSAESNGRHRLATQQIPTWRLSGPGAPTFPFKSGRCPAKRDLWRGLSPCSASTVTALARQEAMLRAALNEMQGDVKRTSRRIETTFQALMSSINIVESERAIREAESISKLTQLAFFFIPLSLVAGVFGMNINVSSPPTHPLAFSKPPYLITTRNSKTT